MRRSALPVSVILASGLLVSGCSGVTTFLGDTHSPIWNPNRPVGDSENMRRVKGQPTDVEPLVPEPGNVWPGPAKPEPTLQDLEQQQNDMTRGVSPGQQQTPFLPDHTQPHPTTRGSSTPPGNGQPGLPPELTGPPRYPVPSSVPGPGPQGQIFQTPKGPAVGTRNQGSTSTINTPGNNGSIVVPNGNGTSTVIAPDGSISTVPTPK